MGIGGREIGFFSGATQRVAPTRLWFKYGKVNIINPPPAPPYSVRRGANLTPGLSLLRGERGAS